MDFLPARTHFPAEEESAEALLRNLHGRALRRIFRAANLHVEGLAAAARRMKRDGVIHARLAKRLLTLDGAVAFLRHATVLLAAVLEKDLDDALFAHMPSALRMRSHNRSCKRSKRNSWRWKTAQTSDQVHGGRRIPAWAAQSSRVAQ